jgi:hypothetical protein
MFDLIVAACHHFICLLSGKFESRRFSISEAILEVYFEFLCDSLS